jgi:hypothetical protein
VCFGVDVDDQQRIAPNAYLQFPSGRDRFIIQVEGFHENDALVIIDPTGGADGLEILVAQAEEFLQATAVALGRRIAQVGIALQLGRGIARALLQDEPGEEEVATMTF